MCNYTGNDFGAHYDDARCVDGYLWDMDSGGCDDNGNVYLDSGGDMPCLQCNTRLHTLSYIDEVEESGYMSVDHPFAFPKSFPKFEECKPSERRLLKRYWMRGRKQRISEELKHT